MRFAQNGKVKHPESDTINPISDYDIESLSLMNWNQCIIRGGVFLHGDYTWLQN